MTPMIPTAEVSAAPSLIARTESPISPDSGGNVEIRLSMILSRAAGSAATQPTRPRTSRMVGMTAKSAAKASPLASSPPPARP